MRRHERQKQVGKGIYPTSLDTSCEQLKAKSMLENGFPLEANTYGEMLLTYITETTMGKMLFTYTT